MIALLLMQQIAVLFLIMGLGFLIVKLGIVETEDSRVLSMVTIYLVLPCVTIHAFQIEYSTKIRNGFLLAVVAAILIHVILFIVCGILRKLLNMDEVETASLIYSNAGNLILPLVTSILGEEWVIYASGFLCVQTIIVWTHGQSLMQGQRQVNWKKIVQNINLIAILVGLVFFLCNIHLPKILDSMTSSLAGMIGPISMVMIGMLLAGVDWKQVFGKSSGSRSDSVLNPTENPSARSYHPAGSTSSSPGLEEPSATRPTRWYHPPPERVSGVP